MWKGSLSRVLESTWSPLDNVYVLDVLEFMNTLGHDQLGAFGVIMLCLFILFCLNSVVAVVYGDFFIRYFKLEERFPYLARFIEIRRKFQHLYLITNIIFIIMALLVIMYVNWIILLR
jgi:hypothetical protein